MSLPRDTLTCQLTVRSSHNLLPALARLFATEPFMQRSEFRLSNHLWPEISARLLRAVSTAHWLEYEE